MFIDTHCHLDFDIFDQTRLSLLQDCQNNDITHFINPATSFDRWQKVIEITQKHSNITPALGLHPVFIEQHDKNHLDLLADWLDTHSIKIVGEIGLDKRIADFPKQQSFFQAQLELAEQYKKPVIIHSVKSHNEIIQILKSIKFTQGGIIHAFNGNINTAKSYAHLGFKLGIGTLLHYPHSKIAKDISQFHIDWLVLESDAPDMPLPKKKNKINTPLSILQTFMCLHAKLSLPKTYLAQKLYHNSLTLIS
ncbi:TatD family hydrolase [Facilibium subflavum]|uniref:TatD family hydrolase n=1 Tax=Facilibium subflavum TaxID=2219058 RepID=UPI0013C2B535|nr:TatD family hydrolase [Facilibium subflavum]